MINMSVLTAPSITTIFLLPTQKAWWYTIPDTFLSS